MSHSLRTYVILVAIFFASLGATWWLQGTGIWHQLAPVPAVAALFGALYQLLRDELQHMKQLALQHDRQQFELGATSHMANVAFDKHVAFCEEYCAELHVTLQALYREGESSAALAQANKLMAIVNRHSVWVTPEIESRLEPFDRALRKLGSSARLAARHPAAAHAGGRMEEMYDIFADVLGLDKEPGKPVNETIAITNVLDAAREILGVRQLIDLRHRLIALRGLPGEPRGN